MECALIGRRTATVSAPLVSPTLGRVATGQDGSFHGPPGKIASAWAALRANDLLLGGTGFSRSWESIGCDYYIDALKCFVQRQIA
jgi:hypothetical protein